MRVEGLYRIFIEVAARNARLVGDNKYEISGLVQQSHGFRRSIDPFKLLGPVGIAVVDVENTVAIEKCRRPANVSALGIFAATAFLVGHWFNGLRMPNLLVQVAPPWHRTGVRLTEFPEWDRAITDFARMAINEKASETEINDEFVVTSSYLS
jgi:hypothetical protein